MLGSTPITGAVPVLMLMPTMMLLLMNLILELTDMMTLTLMLIPSLMNLTKVMLLYETHCSTKINIIMVIRILLEDYISQLISFAVAISNTSPGWKVHHNMALSPIMGFRECKS